jgi:DNA-binding SARP family transcriptional activator
VDFGVLGPLEVTIGGRPAKLAGARTRAVLAVLLVHANQVVPSDRLTEELWPGHPPQKAADSLQVRLSELRKALRSAGEASRLATRPPGYLLQVAPGELDALRFERLAAKGNAALASGDAAGAAQRLDQALGLWRGPALADVDAVPSVRAEAVRLEEERLAAVESQGEALLACGRHRDLIANLEVLTTAHPLRERFWSQRMLALYRAGRKPMRYARTASCAASSSLSSRSSPARSCASSTPGSCARIPSLTVRRPAHRAPGSTDGRAVTPTRCRRSGTPRPATASTSPTWSQGRANGTSCSCPA